MPQQKKSKKTEKQKDIPQPVLQDRDATERGEPTENRPIGGNHHPGELDEKAPKSDDFKRRSEASKRAWQVRRESGNRTSR